MPGWWPSRPVPSPSPVTFTVARKSHRATPSPWCRAATSTRTCFGWCWVADESGMLLSGTLITVAPVAGPIGHLLRTAIDAEQVGATRLHLAADQPDLLTAVSALRAHT